MAFDHDYRSHFGMAHSNLHDEHLFGSPVSRMQAWGDWWVSYHKEMGNKMVKMQTAKIGDFSFNRNSGKISKS